jgi:hypothetical protein
MWVLVTFFLQSNNFLGSWKKVQYLLSKHLSCSTAYITFMSQRTVIFCKQIIKMCELCVLSHCGRNTKFYRKQAEFILEPHQSGFKFITLHQIMKKKECYFSSFSLYKGFQTMELPIRPLTKFLHVVKICSKQNQTYNSSLWAVSKIQIWKLRDWQISTGW